ncbi:MAG: hypothetical protein RLZ12_851 [Bacillota bacterium]|jgi:hypothetical protein
MYLPNNYLVLCIALNSYIYKQRVLTPSSRSIIKRVINFQAKSATIGEKSILAKVKGKKRKIRR